MGGQRPPAMFGDDAWEMDWSSSGLAARSRSTAVSSRCRWGLGLQKGVLCHQTSSQWLVWSRRWRRHSSGTIYYDAVGHAHSGSMQHARVRGGSIWKAVSGRQRAGAESTDTCSHGEQSGPWTAGGAWSGWMDGLGMLARHEEARCRVGHGRAGQGRTERAAPSPRQREAFRSGFSIMGQSGGASRPRRQASAVQHQHCAATAVVTTWAAHPHGAARRGAEMAVLSAMALGPP